MTKVKPTPNCFSCAFNFINNISAWLALPAIKVRCLHKEDRVFKTVYAKVESCFAITVFAFLLVASFSLGRLIEDCWIKRNGVTLSVLLENGTYYLRTAFIILATLARCKTSKQVSEMYEVIMRGWKRVTNRHLLALSHILTIRKSSLLNMSVVGLLLGFYCLYLFFSNFAVSGGSIIRRAASFFCFLADFMLILTYVIASNMEKYMIFNYQAYLREQLVQVLNITKDDGGSRRRGGSLHRAFVVSARLHLSVMLNLQTWYRFCELPLFILTFSYVVISVANGFIFSVFVVSYFEDTPFEVNSELVSLMFQNCVSGGLAIYCIYEIQQVQSGSNDLLSFLYKYPISKLNMSEAVQLEMLITTLNIRKPIFKASDVFIVGTRLLASVSGTIVTYVLVALQFHVAWMKH